MEIILLNKGKLCQHTIDAVGIKPTKGFQVLICPKLETGSPIYTQQHRTTQTETNQQIFARNSFYPVYLLQRRIQLSNSTL